MRAFAVALFTFAVQLSAQGPVGTTNTLYTIPEAGDGGAANDPSAAQLAASPEAQAIIASARTIAGIDLVAEVNRFCTSNAGATAPQKRCRSSTTCITQGPAASARGLSARATV